MTLTYHHEQGMAWPGDAQVTELGGGGSGQFGENSDATTGGAVGESSRVELGGGYIRLGMRGIQKEGTPLLPMQRAPKMCVLLRREGGIEQSLVDCCVSEKGDWKNWKGNDTFLTWKEGRKGVTTRFLFSRPHYKPRRTCCPMRNL